MTWIGVVLATVAAFGAGAVWYNVFSKAWIADSGVPVDSDGKPVGGRSIALVFAGGFVCTLIVAGMMRHMLAASGITAPVAGLVAGAGVGLFFITPWLTLNVLYAMRPLRLAAIDGGYATLACAIMGLVLTLV